MDEARRRRGGLCFPCGCRIGPASRTGPCGPAAVPARAVLRARRAWWTPGGPLEPRVAWPRRRMAKRAGWTAAARWTAAPAARWTGWTAASTARWMGRTAAASRLATGPRATAAAMAAAGAPAAVGPAATPAAAMAAGRPGHLGPGTERLGLLARTDLDPAV